MRRPAPRSTPAPGSRTAWTVRGLGVVACAVAVLQRTSFGVAVTEAATRFDVAASLLSAFTVLQPSTPPSRCLPACWWTSPGPAAC